jgi:hypothetical protein
MAGSASAAPPQRLERTPPLTLQACGTTLTITDLSKGKVHMKEGSETVKFTGPFTTLITTADGRSATIRPNGMARETFLGFDPETNTVRIRVDARGRNVAVAVTPVEQALNAALGYPQLALSSGPVTSILTIDVATGTVVDIELLRRPNQVTDVCTLLR